MEPLKLSDRMKPALEFIENNPGLAEYAEPLKRVAVYRLLEQLGKVYSLMQLPEVGKLASFTTLSEVGSPVHSQVVAVCVGGSPCG